MNKFVFLNKRPRLTIEYMGGAEISNCYSSSTWKITSDYYLKKETILKLRDAGVIGSGQEFFIKSQCDGREQPAGHDLVECTEMDRNGNIIPGVAMNPYSGKPYEATKQPYFEYLCESRCDSGD